MNKKLLLLLALGLSTHIVDLSADSDINVIDEDLSVVELVDPVCAEEVAVLEENAEDITDELSMDEFIDSLKQGVAEGFNLNTLFESHDARFPGYKTVLFSAVECGELRLVEAIVDLGADVNLGEAGFSPLYAAIAGENSEMVKTLFALGADINTYLGGNSRIFLPNDEGVSAVEVTIVFEPLFMTALGSGNEEIINVCLSRLTNVNELIAEDSTLTYLHYAAKHASLSVVKSLVAAGANVMAQTEDGYTAYDYAVIAERQDVIDFLAEEMKKFSDA